MTYKQKYEALLHIFQSLAESLNLISNSDHKRRSYDKFLGTLVEQVDEIVRSPTTEENNG